MELDIVKQETTPHDELIEGAPDDFRTQVGIVPCITSGLHLVGPLYATLHLGMRIIPVKTKYLAELRSEESETEIIFIPWHVQFRFSLGVYVLLF